MAFWTLAAVLCFVHDHSDRTGRHWESWRDERPLDPATRFLFGPPRPIPWGGRLPDLTKVVKSWESRRLWTGPYFDPLTRCVQLGNGFAMRPGGPLLGPGIDAAPDLTAAAAKLKERWVTDKLSMTGIPVAALREPLPRGGGTRREITMLERIDLDICDFDGTGPKLYWFNHISLGLLSNANPAFIDVLFVDTEVMALFSIGETHSTVSAPILTKVVDTDKLPSNKAGRIAKALRKMHPDGPPVEGIRELARHHKASENTIRTAFKLNGWR
jgi:hypothetical protein